MTNRTWVFLALAGAVAGMVSCDKSGSDTAVARYATSRPSGVPAETEPDIGPKPHTGPKLLREPTVAYRVGVTGPFPLTKLDGKEVTLPDGLKYIDIKEGTGPEPKKDQNVWVDYTGWLEDGTMFDTSRTGGIPFHFTLGESEVIKGWDEGVATMKPGGKRRLIIPATLAYGAEAKGDKIPANSTLIFDIDLLAVSNDGD